MTCVRKEKKINSKSQIALPAVEFRGQASIISICTAENKKILPSQTIDEKCITTCTRVRLFLSSSDSLASLVSSQQAKSRLLLWLPKQPELNV
jgi:hypothetical protein